MTINRCVAALTVAGSLFSLTTLTGCPAVLGVTAVTAASSAADRRTVGIQVEDRNIQLKANSALNEKLGDGAHVNVTVYNRKILLTGQAPDEFTKNRAEGAVSNIENVRAVVNDIQVSGASSLTSRSNDALITGKVKASLIDAGDVSSSAFKVTTEAGAVYLMGLVTASEADRAAQLASGVSGVQRVVKVIDEISETQLSRIKSGNRSGEPREPGPVSASGK
ncbi:MAG: BON domain-containing protein [Limnobacter sp.]|nr:BON domain-containing protein [Limnobacter sp.]